MTESTVPVPEPEETDTADAPAASDNGVEPEGDEAEEDAEEGAEEDAGQEAAEEADEETEEDAPAVKAGLIDAVGTVNTDRIVEFGGQAHALVHEVLGRLEDELVAVLADYEARHTDPAAAASLPASRAIRAHADDARRHLSALAVACQDLATAATA